MDTKETVRAELDAHRAQIDEIDQALVALLDKRAGHSLAIRALKPQLGMELYDPAREEQIFAKVASYSNGTLHAAQLRQIYESLLIAMKENPAS